MLLVHNPLGLTCTAICYIVVESIAQAIVYNLGGSHTVGSAVAYTVLVAEMAAFYVSDLHYVWQHTVYLISPYITLIWLFVGALVRQSHQGTWEWGFSAFLLAISILAFIVKLGATFYRVWHLGYRYDEPCVCHPKKEAKRKRTQIISAPTPGVHFQPKGILRNSQKRSIEPQSHPVIVTEPGDSNPTMDSYTDGVATVYHVPAPTRTFHKQSTGWRGGELGVSHTTSCTGRTRQAVS